MMRKVFIKYDDESSKDYENRINTELVQHEQVNVNNLWLSCPFSNYTIIAVNNSNTETKPAPVIGFTKK